MYGNVLEEIAWNSDRDRSCSIERGPHDADQNKRAIDLKRERKSSSCCPATSSVGANPHRPFLRELQTFLMGHKSRCNGAHASVSPQGHHRTVMQAQEVLRQLRVPELDDLRQYIRGLPINALVGMGTFAAITTYWFASRPKAIKPRCDLSQQSVEIPVSDVFFSFLDHLK